MARVRIRKCTQSLKLDPDQHPIWILRTLLTMTRTPIQKRAINTLQHPGSPFETHTLPMAKKQKPQRLPRGRTSVTARIDELFRDASRLSALTGAQVAAVTVLPSGEVRAYGCPSLDAVIDGYVRHADNSESSSFAPWLDELKLKYIHSKRREDALKNTGGSAQEQEWKELMWECEFLVRFKADLQRSMAKRSAVCGSSSRSSA